MGNCMETCYTTGFLDEASGNITAAGDKTAAGYDSDDENCGLDMGAPGGKGGLKVKIVLTKAELEWLMLRLSEEKGGGVEGAALELALEEILKDRKPNCAGERQGRPWKPSLECIMECPETQSFEEDRLGR